MLSFRFVSMASYESSQSAVSRHWCLLQRQQWLLSYLLTYAYCPSLGIGHGQGLSRDPVLGHLLQLSPCMARPLHICIQVTPPGDYWFASLHFLLWIPEVGLTCDVRCRLVKGMANPSPASLEDFFLNRLLPCLLSKVHVQPSVLHPLHTRLYWLLSF